MVLDKQFLIAFLKPLFRTCGLFMKPTGPFVTTFGHHKVEIGAPRNHGNHGGAHQDNERQHPHPVISTCMTQNL